MAPIPPVDLTVNQQSLSDTANSGHTSHSSPLFTRLLNRLQPSPEAVVMLLAVLIGGGTGMGIVTFHYLIELIHSLTLEY
ncbi:MAG TPA: hypothetical protein VIQ31_21410, partial [Phormidium sp.]